MAYYENNIVFVNNVLDKYKKHEKIQLKQQIKKFLYWQLKNFNL